MLNDTIAKPKHHWIFKGNPLIKAVADKAKAEGYRVWLNTDNTCYPEATYGFMSTPNGDKLIYFQMETFQAFVQFSVELVPSRELGSGYILNKEDMTSIEKINKELDISKLFDCAKPQKDYSGTIHNLYTLSMKEHDPWGLEHYAEY